MLKSSVLGLGLWAISQFASAQDIQVFRTPSINASGTSIAFSYQGDIWTVPKSGGTATRLTVHEAYENMPLFSPDGKKIAFTGERFGNNDIYVMPIEGGIPTRLTVNSASDMVSSWKGNSDIVFSTAREYRQIERPLEVYQISANGGTEMRVLDAVGFDPVYSPNGRFLAFVRGDINPVYREDYKGPSNREIWIYDTKLKSYSKLDLFDTNDTYPQWLNDSQLLFMSSEKGTYNVYSVGIDANGKQAGKPMALTSNSEYGIRYYSAAGNHVVYELKDAIYYFSITNGKASTPEKVAISIRADERFDATETITNRSGANEYAVSPNGKKVAFTVRGEIFVSEANKEKSKSVNVSESPFRDMNPNWLNDSVLVFVSDRFDSNFELLAVQSSDKNESDLFKTLKREIVRITKTKEDESNPVTSPSGKKLAYNLGRGKLIIAEVEKDLGLAKSKTLLDGWATASDIAWSPDDQYIAYSVSDLTFNEEVYIHAADHSSKPVNVTMHPRTDGLPFWSADGSKLGFISERNNLSFDIWFAWLKKSDFERSQSDWEDDESEEEKKESKAKKGSVKPVEIDLEGIHERLVQVTNKSGNETQFVISNDGETFFFTAANSSADGSDLYSIQWDGKKLKELTNGGSNPFRLSLDQAGKQVYYLKRGGSINRLDVKSSKSESLPYVAKMKIDYKAERAQIFDEAWRTIRDGFYDPNYHGYDWEALGKKYRPLAINASTNTDFAELFNFLLGELNASHMRLTAPDRAETQREQTGLLGVELMPVKNGMQVNRVIPGTPADKITSKLMEGDIILGVNGEEVSDSKNFYGMLNGTVNEKTILKVRSKDKKDREVIIRPSNSVRQDMYQEWVMERKKLVEKYSKGRLGYIHIQGMNLPSFEVFERELTAAGYDKEALVIDVRYNGGGFTTDYLMTVLNYKQHAYTIPRGAAKDLEKEKSKFREYYPTGERLVYAAWTKPSIALCNEGSYSNAEIFSHAYKQLGIGTLVGIATNGSVISTGGLQLIDGSFVRLPFRGWYTKATDKNQELGPAIPDITVENNPDWISTGNDAQLKRAVDELIKQLDKK